MGTIAGSMSAYAQPLLDETDGSIEQMQNAFSIAQVCWNLALLPEQEQRNSIIEMNSTLKMSNDEFIDFCASVVAPMIRRHREMFPKMIPEIASTGVQNMIPEIASTGVQKKIILGQGATNHAHVKAERSISGVAESNDISHVNGVA